MFLKRFFDNSAAAKRPSQIDALFDVYKAAFVECFLINANEALSRKYAEQTVALSVPTDATPALDALKEIRGTDKSALHGFLCSIRSSKKVHYTPIDMLGTFVEGLVDIEITGRFGENGRKLEDTVSKADDYLRGTMSKEDYIAAMTKRANHMLGYRIFSDIALRRELSGECMRAALLAIPAALKQSNPELYADSAVNPEELLNLPKQITR